MYSKMLVKVVYPNSDKVSSFEIGNKLFDVGNGIKNLVTEKPELSNDRDSQFLAVFADVISAIGLLFKNDDALAQHLEQLLMPLSSYTSLLSYFLLIKSILINVQSVMEVDLKEHKDRLEWINMELTRIAVIVTSIAKNLEDLGKSLIDIARGGESQKAAISLIIFDIHYDEVSCKLSGCISDMETVKLQIDKGLGSIRAFKKRTVTIMVCGGAFAAAAAIIAPLAGVYLGIFAACGMCLLPGAGLFAAMYVGGGPVSLWKDFKTATKIEKCYVDQKCNWKQLNGQLKTMREQLDCHRRHRSKMDT